MGFWQGKKIIIVSILAISLFSFACPEASFAQGPNTDPAATSDTKTDSGINGFGALANRLQITGASYYVFSILTSVGSVVAWIGGFLLDVSIGLFMVGMYSTADTLGLTDAIYIMWGIVRDLFNLVFIFGLIWAGFKLILNLDEAGSKRLISSIIIAALLINFSLYVAQAVVDFTNVMASQIHELITPVEKTTILGIDYTNISSSFINLSNVDRTLTNADELAEEAGVEIDSVPGAFVLGILFCIFYAILGFVFAAGGFLIFSRFIALILLMIFSPVFFLGKILPYFKKYSDEWQKLFVSQALVGPVFLFMIYLSLRTLDGLNTVSGEDYGIYTIIIYLLIVCAFLWASLVTARSVGSWGAYQAYNIGNQAAAFAGRNTIGRFAAKWDKDMENRGVSEKSAARRLASTLSGSKYGGSYTWNEDKAAREKAQQKQSRYDQLYGKEWGGGIRRGGILQAIQSGGIEMERAISGASNEQILQLLQKYKPGSSEYKKIVANMSASQFDSAMKAKVEELDDTAKAELSKLRKEAVINSVTKSEREKNDALPESDRKDVAEIMSLSIKNASDAQLKVLGTDEIAKNAAYLKQSQIDSIMKSNDYTESEKDIIRKNREDRLWDLFVNSPDLPFKGKKDGEIAKLPEKILKELDAARYLTTGSLKKMMDDDTVTEEVRKTIKTNLQMNRAGVTNKVDPGFWDTPLGKNF